MVWVGNSFAKEDVDQFPVKIGGVVENKVAHIVVVDINRSFE